MTELKTKPTRKSVAKFLKSVGNKNRRKDCEHLIRIMREITGEKPVLWGDSIVGFGSYQYSQRSGQVAIWPLTGFSPRKQSLTIYIMPGFGQYKRLLPTLGKHKHSVSCLYINKLEDVDISVLSEMIADSVSVMREKYSKDG